MPNQSKVIAFDVDQARPCLKIERMYTKPRKNGPGLSCRIWLDPIGELYGFLTEADQCIAMNSQIHSGLVSLRSSPTRPAAASLADLASKSIAPS